MNETAHIFKKQPEVLRMMYLIFCSILVYVIVIMLITAIVAQWTTKH